MCHPYYVCDKLEPSLPSWDRWQQQYEPYIDRKVFRGGYSGGSKEFRKHVVNGCIEYLGGVNRFKRYKDREIPNGSFREYCEMQGMSVPAAYRQVKCNSEAGWKSFCKYDRKQPSPDRRVWYLASQFMRRHFWPYLSGSREMSLEECISDSDKTTSCGYPWSLKWHTKQEFYEDAEAPKVFEHFWRDLANEQEYVPIWTCSQKQEIRSAEKIAQNKIRTFTASPIEHSISANRLCLDFNNRFYNSANKHWSFVGASKYLRGWDISLFKRLSVFKNAFATDGKDFDASCFEKMMWEICNFRIECLCVEANTADNRKRLRQLYKFIIHSVVVMENGDLVWKHTGNPSGSTNTIVDNTLINFFYLAYTWIKLHIQKYPDMIPTYESYVGNVCAALNGDDDLHTVSDEHAEWFNPTAAIPICASDLGLVVTTDSCEPRRLEDCDFLSQNFVQINGIWLPSPDTDKVLSSLMWNSEIDDVRWHLLRASALRNESWCNIECRKIIQGYIEYLLRVYASDMYGDVAGLKMEHIYSVYKSDRWIWALYTGIESYQCDAEQFIHHASGVERRLFEVGDYLGDQFDTEMIDLQLRRLRCPIYRSGCARGDCHHTKADRIGLGRKNNSL